MSFVCTLNKRIRNCDGLSSECSHCGFEWKEAERRKGLPLVYDEDGLRRKYVRKEALR